MKISYNRFEELQQEHGPNNVALASDTIVVRDDRNSEWLPVGTMGTTFGDYVPPTIAEIAESDRQDEEFVEVQKEWAEQDEDDE